METAQKMVDEAANKAMPNSLIKDENSKLLTVYHGSPGRFTVFRHHKMNINGPHTRAVFLCYKLSADRICELKSLNPFTCDEISASYKDFVFINLNYNTVTGFIVNNFC